MGLIGNLIECWEDFKEEHPTAARRIKIGTAIGGAALGGLLVGKHNQKKEDNIKMKALEQKNIDLSNRCHALTPDLYKDDEPFLISAEDNLGVYPIEPEPRKVVGEFYYSDNHERLNGYVMYEEDAAEEMLEYFGKEGTYFEEDEVVKVEETAE